MAVIPKHLHRFNLMLGLIWHGYTKEDIEGMRRAILDPASVEAEVKALDTEGFGPLPQMDKGLMLAALSEIIREQAAEIAHLKAGRREEQFVEQSGPVEALQMGPRHDEEGQDDHADL
jgi:hypothetical protein